MLCGSFLWVEWVAGAAWVLIFSFANGLGELPWISVPLALLPFILSVFVLRRVGLVAASAMGFVATLFYFPMTLRTSAWYASAGYAALLIVLALTAYGIRTALGSRPVFNLDRVEDWQKQSNLS